MNILLNDVAVQVESATFDISVQTEPLVNDFAVQVDFKFSEKVQAQVQTEHAYECHSCTQLMQENGKLLKSTATLSQESMKCNEDKVQFYTGLPNYANLILIIQFVTNGLPLKGKLSHFQQILLVLMKLRLNLEEQDLAYRFSVSQSTVSRVFRKWMYRMSEQLMFLIHWPCREYLCATMRMGFRTFFGNCVCILDCTEIFIERPSNLQARAQTWSEYKHHNTIKVLVAITPQGTISFLSKAWGGRASDKYITEHCGVLNNLLPGDLILADRGFTIEDSVSLYCAQVLCPPFTKGKRQLSRHEVDWSREISRVRIHIEHVIGQLKKKFKLLEGVVPISMLKEKTPTDTIYIDCILTVCAALCNLSPSVVPFTHTPVPL